MISGVQASVLLIHFCYLPNTRSRCTKVWQWEPLVRYACDAPLSRSARLDFATFYFRNRTRRGSTSVSTVLRKSVRVFIWQQIDIYFKKGTVQFEIWKMVWTIFFFSFLALDTLRDFSARFARPRRKELANILCERLQRVKIENISLGSMSGLP